MTPLSSLWLCLCSRECFKGSPEIITASVLWKSNCSFCHGNKSSSPKQCRGNWKQNRPLFYECIVLLFFNAFHSPFIALHILLYPLTLFFTWWCLPSKYHYKTAHTWRYLNQPLIQILFSAFLFRTHWNPPSNLHLSGSPNHNSMWR